VGRARQSIAAKLDALTERSRRHEGLLGVVCALALMALAWPHLSQAVLFPDSIEYLRWPAAVRPEGVMRQGPRMPGYSLFLQAVGTGAPLVYLQSGLSLFAFSWLGWLVARWPGLLLGGLFCLAPELRIWPAMALTESLTFSLLALTVAMGLALAQCWRLWLFVLWAGAVAFFAALRAPNVLIVPFLLAPFVAQLRASDHSPSLGKDPPRGWQRFAAATGLLAVVSLGGVVLTEKSELWRVNYHTVMFERIVVDDEALDFFHAAGLPDPLVWKSEAFANWFDAHGRTTYHRWLLARPESFVEAWHWLRPPGQGDELRRKYVEARFERRPDEKERRIYEATLDAIESPASRVGALIFAALAPPQWLWLAIFLLPFWRGRQEGGVKGRVEVWSLTAAVLGAGAYAQCFATYHASAAEEVRHTLAATLLYRISFVIALAALFRGLRSASGGGGVGPGRVAADARSALDRRSATDPRPALDPRSALDRRPALDRRSATSR